MNEDNLPCVCRHMKVHHQLTINRDIHPGLDHFCLLCIEWHTFKLDNLGYLEQRYEKSNKIY